MYATPIVFGFGGSFLLIQASPQACHSLSRHIESPARSSMHIHPFVPARSSFILPSAPVPMTAAWRPMSGGAALVAFAMTAASDLAPPALVMPSWPDLGGSFALSCATAAVAAATRSTALSVAMILRMMTSLMGDRFCGLRRYPTRTSRHAATGGVRMVSDDSRGARA